MPFDFAALARSIGAVPGVRVCLIVSREGLALAVAPESQEGAAAGAWSKLAALGDVEKGFVAVGGETWVFCRRGPFAALAIADPSSRPGVILTQMEQALLAADEARVQGREALRPPSTRPATGTDPVQQRFRAPLHPAPAEPAQAPAPAAATPPRREPESPARPAQPRPRADEDSKVDVVELFREFGGLYGESGPEKPGD